MGFFDTLLAFFVGKSIADTKKKPAHKSHHNDTSNSNYRHTCSDDCDCEHEYCSHDSFDDNYDSLNDDSFNDDSHDSFNDDYDSFNDDSFDDDRY